MQCATRFAAVLDWLDLEIGAACYLLRIGQPQAPSSLPSKSDVTKKSHQIPAIRGTELPSDVLGDAGRALSFAVREREEGVLASYGAAAGEVGW